MLMISLDDSDSVSICVYPLKQTPAFFCKISRHFLSKYSRRWTGMPQTCRIKRLVGRVEHARHHREILNRPPQKILIIKKAGRPRPQ
jgi:hypothetical protein